MKKILLDTNAYSNLLRGDQRVYELIIEANEILISPIVAGEILFGFMGGSKAEENEERFNNFIKRPTVVAIEVTFETSHLFAQIKYELKIKGRPIPINDIWIAAQAMEYNAMLATEDHHFKFIDRLQLSNSLIT